MAKSTTPPKTADTGKGNKLAHLVKVAADKLSTIAATPKLLIILGLLLFAAVSFFSYSAGATSFALLYIFGFDGKMSGRMDGNVLMRNGRGRGFTVPSLVQNANTTLARSVLAQLSQNFRGLTVDQINSWNAFEMTTSNRFGQTKIIKGKTCFVRLNANLINIGQTPINNPPSLTDVPGITSLTVTATTTGVVLTFAPTPTDANVSHKVFATACVSAGISRPSKSAFRFIDVIPNSTASTVDVFAAYSARFGAPLSTQKLFIKLVPVHETTGQEGIGIVAADVVA